MVESQESVRLVYTDAGGGDVDFCVLDDSGHVGVLEVTRDTDEDWRRQEAQLAQDEGFLESEVIRGSWQLELARDVGPRQVKRRLLEIESILSSLELQEIDSYPWSGASDELVEALGRLGVTSGYRRSSDAEVGVIRLAPSAVWWLGDEHLNESIAVHVRLNEGKLRSRRGMRHLFLWQEFHSLAGFMELRDGRVPAQPPPLGDSVDEVWVCPAHWIEPEGDLPLWRGTTLGWSVTTLTRKLWD